jgi:hypothetical protein
MQPESELPRLIISEHSSFKSIQSIDLLSIKEYVNACAHPRPVALFERDLPRAAQPRPEVKLESLESVNPNRFGVARGPLRRLGTHVTQLVGGSAGPRARWRRRRSRPIRRRPAHPHQRAGVPRTARRAGPPTARCWPASAPAPARPPVLLARSPAPAWALRLGRGATCAGWAVTVIGLGGARRISADPAQAH